jgi:hypothetical protein
MKMEGIDKDWQFVGNQHQVRFSNLPSGRYILKIKASKDGIHWTKRAKRTLLSESFLPGGSRREHI